MRSNLVLRLLQITALVMLTAATIFGMVLLVAYGISVVQGGGDRGFFAFSIDQVDQGAATIISVAIGIIAAGATAYVEYRSRRRQIAKSSALQLINEIITLADEMDDIMWFASQLGLKRRVTRTWFAILVKEGMFDESLAKMFSQKRTILKTRTDAPWGIGQVTKFAASLAAAEPPAQAFEDERETSFRHRLGEADMRDLTPVDVKILKSAPDVLRMNSTKSAYTSALPSMTDLSGDERWTDSIFSIGQFYENFDLAITKYDRFKSSLLGVDEGDFPYDNDVEYPTPNLPRAMDYCLSWYLLFLYRLNMYYAPLALSRTLIAYQKDIDSEIFKHASDRLKKFYDAYRNDFLEFEQNVARGHEGDLHSQKEDAE